MNFKKSLLFSILPMFNAITQAQTIIPLYEGTIPNSRPCEIKETDMGNGRVSTIITPVLYAYLPQKRDSNKTCVIIFPGGGYTRLAIDHEGFQVAEALNKRGIAAFVLKYRQPHDIACIENPETVAQMDAQQAITIVRGKAAGFNINPDAIGLLGFSAGGHLASTIGTHFTNSLLPSNKPINLRPDFLVLAYPVISFSDSLAHKGSRDNMLGPKPSAEKIKLYSNELQVTPQTPPTFLLHAADDHAVIVENSLHFFMALQQNKVPAEMHIYQKGGHGFGLQNKAEPNDWLSLVYAWLKTNKLMKGNVGE
ncbi:alpha/beta hydrolase [Parasediminibacterium sp. JCM 36343]|uniref:alpha/beta hydrolase n=1 Tax=Parasediminibacterium sp. JCM 36343 TaxID=3374279 RepID=UPI00397C3619